MRNYWEEGEHDFRVSLGGNFERQGVEYKGCYCRASLCDGNDGPLIDIWVAGVATLHSLLQRLWATFFASGSKQRQCWSDQANYVGSSMLEFGKQTRWVRNGE